METKEEKPVINKIEEGQKKQQVSATYTLRAIGINAKKLEKLELITKEQVIIIQEIQKKAVEKYVTQSIK